MYKVIAELSNDLASSVQAEATMWKPCSQTIENKISNLQEKKPNYSS